MSAATVEEFTKNIATYLEKARTGEPVLICDHDVPVARLEPVPQTRPEPMRKAGWARGSVEMADDLVAPAISAEEWGSMWPADEK